MENNKVYLDRNENNYGPAPACFEVLKNADLTKLSWYTREYTRGVKSILSEKLAEEFELTEDRIVLGYGAEDLLKQSIQCFLGKDQKLMIPAYSWWYYKKMADEVEGKNVEYPMIVGEDSFYYDINTMIDLYNSEKPDMVFISSPNNPTGNSIKHEDLIKVLDALKDTIVVLDEAYFYKSLNRTVKELIETYDKLIVIRTFSKYYALAGVRIGFALLGKDLSDLSKFTNRYLGYHRLSEEMAIAALNSEDYYLDIADKMNADKELYYSELGKIEGFKVFKSNANFILVEIPDEIKDRLKNFLTERNLIIKFMNEDILNSHLRITLGTQEQNRMVIDALKQFAAKELPK